METPFDQERLSDYHKRFAEWIGKQGLFFQLRHTGIVEGSSLVKQLGGLLVRFLIVLFVILGIGYFFLTRHFSSEGYGEVLVAGIEETMGLEEVEASGFHRRRGSGGFRDLSMKGGAGSFFFDAKVENLVAPFEFLTGINSAWNPEELRMDEVQIEIKAGGTDEEMDQAFDVILKSFRGDGVKRVVINKLYCDWGYSKLTYGRIGGAEFKADLENGTWKIELSGGTFQQNWLKGFRIESGKLEVSKDGISVESLVLKNQNGSLNLKGKIGGPVSRPTLDLAGDFQNLPLESLVSLQGVRVREYFSGQISGSLEISGSTNTGVRTKAKVELADGDQITLRERWAILRAVSVLDVDRTYRRIDFTEGSFDFETGGGTMKISDLNLKAGKVAVLLGNLETRLPSQEEAAESLGITLTEGFSDSFKADYTDSSSSKNLEHARMSLAKAAEDGERMSEFEARIDEMKRQLRGAKRELTADERESILLMQEMDVYRIDGELKLAVPAEAFEKYDKLIELYPEDEEGWRWLEIPVESTFASISQKTTDKLLKESLIKEYRENSIIPELKNK
ncbi:MAG: hypothetical protein ACON5N_12380 [Akkermansiaceae bacterium]